MIHYSWNYQPNIPLFFVVNGGLKRTEPLHILRRYGMYVNVDSNNSISSIYIVPFGSKKLHTRGRESSLIANDTLSWSSSTLTLN